MNIKPHLIKILVTAVLSVTAAASAAADDFERLYSRPGVTVVSLYPPMLNGLEIDNFVNVLQADFAVQRLDNIVVFSADKAVVNADFDKINNDIQRIIENVKPEPQIIMQTIDEGERTAIYGQAGSDDKAGREFSRIIIFSNDGDEINLINIGGSIAISSE